MASRTYGLAISTVVAVVVGVIETCKNTRELYERGIPTDYLNVFLSIVMVASGIYVLQELRHRLHILGRRNTLSALADMGFWITCFGALYLIIHGLWNTSWQGVLLIFAVCIPLSLFGFLRNELAEQPDTDQLNIFEWEQERRRLLERSAQLERDLREHERFLKENPDAAAYEKLPMSIKIRMGM